MQAHPAPPPHRRHAIELTTAGPSGGAWHRHKLATLGALRHAALELALARGVDAITVAEITTAAGVSRRTFFNYFATKEDALVGETPQLTSFLQQAVLARPGAEPPLTAVEHAIRQTYGAFVTDDARERIRARHQLLTQHPELLPRHLARYAAIEQLLATTVTTRLDQHHTPETDPGLLATQVVGALRLCLRRWAEHGAPSLEQRLATAFAAIRHGLA